MGFLIEAPTVDGCRYANPGQFIAKRTGFFATQASTALLGREWSPGLAT